MECLAIFSVRSATSLSTLKTRLKTHLFTLAFGLSLFYGFCLFVVLLLLVLFIGADYYIL